MTVATINTVDDIGEFLGKAIEDEDSNPAPGTLDEDMLGFIRDENPSMEELTVFYMMDEFHVEAFQTGWFELSGGGHSTYYGDLRRMWEYPLGRILGANVLADKVEEDVIEDDYTREVVGFGIPTEGMYASIEMADAGGWRQGYVRDDGPKGHGTGRAIETVRPVGRDDISRGRMSKAYVENGEIYVGRKDEYDQFIATVEQVRQSRDEFVKIMADGVSTSGKSFAKAAEQLRKSGYGEWDEDRPLQSVNMPGEIVAVPILDRQEGAYKRLSVCGIDLYPVFTPQEVFKTAYETGVIGEEGYTEFTQNL